MATVISYIFEDSEGNQKSVPVYYDATAINDVATAQASAAAFVLAKANISGSKIVDASVTFDLAVSDLTSIAAGSRNDAGGTMQFSTAGGRKWSLYIPAMPVSLLVGGNTDFANALFDNMEGHLIASGVSPYDAALLALVGGKQTTRK